MFMERHWAQRHLTVYPLKAELSTTFCVTKSTKKRSVFYLILKCQFTKTQVIFTQIDSQWYKTDRQTDKKWLIILELFNVQRVKEASVRDIIALIYNFISHIIGSRGSGVTTDPRPESSWDASCDIQHLFFASPHSIESTALQGQKAVTAYLKSKQLQPSGFALQRTLRHLKWAEGWTVSQRHKSQASR